MFRSLTNRTKKVKSKTQKKAETGVSIHSYAFGLRKRLLRGTKLEDQLDLHREHQKVLTSLDGLSLARLRSQDRFAAKFLKEVNVLRPEFTQKSVKQEGKGVFHDLNAIVENVQRIWFPEMEEAPKVKWLKHFSTRKLAHYHMKKDEIAFSLIFDSLQVSAEILNYLAYHELLHRKLGVVLKDGRRYAHTPEFKSHELRYPDADLMDEKIRTFLMNL